jgi:hypothetical protein
MRIKGIFGKRNDYSIRKEKVTVFIKNERRWNKIALVLKVYQR